MKKISLLAAAVAATALFAAPVSAGDAPTETIAEIASGNPDFSTLVAALGAADLVGAFDSCDDAPTTVFAPTNDAFAAALSALGLTAEELLGNTELLTSILTYHVVPGAVDAATVVGLDSATTLNGADIAITVDGSNVVLNGTVNVVATDIIACNGIIHVIDAVLVPPAAPPAGGGEIPSTGSETEITLLIGVGLLAAGLAAMRFGRRTATAR